MASLVEQLDSFSADERREALANLLSEHPDRVPETGSVNMHMHSFFSFNGEGYSPSRLVWEARQAGLYGMGVCDFDVLDALEEVLAAGDLARVRTAVGFESRVFFPEYAEHEINSPGEPGVFYFMGMGFRELPAPESQAGRVFADMLTRSHQRNRALIERINGRLGDLALDYDADVLPLTPAGNATERHIVRSYFDKAIALHGGRDGAVRFWAGALGADPAKLTALMADENAFVDMLRSRMMKEGGLGYVQPTRDTFPPLDDVVTMILDCQAIPMSTWLDGTRSGESDPEAQLACLMEKGVAAVNIIPDRNWNLKDPDDRARKVAELHRYARVAEALDLPVNVGTELNKPGQRFVDDFEAEPMAPLAPLFLKGAQVMVGHTRLFRFADFSYVSAEAASVYPERADRNEFFAAVGALPAPGAEALGKLWAMEAEQAFAYIQDSVRDGRWR